MITEFDVRRRLRASILDDLARSIGVPQSQVSIPEVPEALPPTGGVPWDESGALKVSQSSYDYTRSYWDQIGATVVGRHVFDLTDGWGGKPPSGIDHVVVVTHRPEPEGWDPEAPFRFVDGVEAAVATAQELAGDRTVEVAAGEVGGQVLAAGLVDEVRMDVVPVVLGSGKRYFGSVPAQHLLEDPDVVIRGDRVLHLRYPVRRS